MSTYMYVYYVHKQPVWYLFAILCAYVVFAHIISVSLSLSLFQSYLYMIMGFYTTIVANDGDAGLCETGFFADGME